MGFTHGIVSGIYPWFWPMVSTYGIYAWYFNSKKAINNKPQFVKGQIVRHNVASTVILCFNNTSFFVVLFSLCSLFFSGIIILQILSDPFQLFRSWGPPPQDPDQRSRMHLKHRRKILGRVSPLKYQVPIMPWMETLAVAIAEINHPKDAILEG